jgi:formate dehydrogenase major subunit
VLKEINGYDLTTGALLPGLRRLKADGSTSCGCWIYSGVYKDGVNQSARRKPGREQDWVAREWGWVWPMDRRTLYNRASADPGRQAVVGAQEVRVVGRRGGRVDRIRRAGLREDKPPSYRPPEGASGVAAIAGDDAFIMQGDGKGWLYAPSGLIDGPHADALRAGRVDGAQPALHTAGQPDPQDVPAAGQPAEPEPAGTPLRRVSVRVQHQPAHRAPHRPAG